MNTHAPARPPTPAVVSHRGLAVNHPENSIPAFLAAIQQGVDMVELDAHETADSEFVVFHDDQLDQKTPPWGALSTAAIRSLTSHTPLAPDLASCLRATGNVPINLEIKSCREASHLQRYLERHPLSPGSVVSSADYGEGGRSYHTLRAVALVAVSATRDDQGRLIARLSPRILASYALPEG